MSYIMLACLNGRISILEYLAFIVNLLHAMISHSFFIKLVEVQGRVYLTTARGPSSTSLPNVLYRLF